MKWFLILLLLYGQQFYIREAYATKSDPRITKLQAFFHKYKSPLEGQERNFINTAYIFDFDYRFLPSIAMVESGGCKNDFGTKNCFGLLSQGHLIHFDSYNESIWATAKTIYSYGVNGQEERFATIYCGCNEKEYLYKLKYFIAEL